jgi:insulysin
LNRLYRAWIQAVALAVVAATAATLLAGCTSVPHAAPATSIVQSPNDDRLYRRVELDNGLTVLLIADTEAEKAAASLAVFSGSNEDPDDRLGLAHFLEHMLFLGTDAYPDVDAYGRYISTHGGSKNAYVAADHTNYFFDIQPEYLEGALDRFAPFFTSPRFDPEYVEREKNAVHSEYQMQLRNDSWRSFAVFRAIMNPEHPGSRFNIGSLETLEGVTRDELRAFYEQHYSAENMALVVLGNQSLDTLEDWVRARFSAIPGHDPAPPADLAPAFAPGALPKVVTFQSLRDVELLRFNFPVPPTDEHYDRQPLEYLANLIGHEGEGSLHAVLTDRGWIESLSAGARRMDRGNAALTVSMRLTSAGTQHVAEITDALFAYLRLIDERGIEPWRYEEQSALAELQFRFQEQTSPLGYVYTLAPRFQLYPAREVLVAPYLMREYDERLIRQYLAELRPDNVLIERSGPEVETDRVEPWFEVPYAVRPVRLEPSTREADLLAALSLPRPNPFLPEDLSVTAAVDSVPANLIGEQGLSLWLARDGSFDVPRASTYLMLAIDGGVLSQEDIVHAHLFASQVEHELNAYAYPARLAGLHYQVSPHHAGFLITLSGYSDRQAVLARHILDVFRTVDIDVDRLTLHREELARGWRNFRNERAYLQSHAGIRHLLVDGSWPPPVLAQRIAEVTPESLQSWIERRLQRFHVTGMLHGNFDEDDAREMAQQLRAGLPLAALPLSEPAVQALHGAGAVNYGVEINEDDATMVLYLQASDDSLAQRAFMGLSAQILRNAYFNDLRTEQQLGYVVMATPTVLHRRGGLSFIVQSPVTGPGELFEITRRFLETYRNELATMPADEFEAHKQGLISQLLEQDRNLTERSQRFWRDIELGYAGFDTRQRIAGHVAEVDRDIYLAFYDDLLAKLDMDRLVVFSTGRFRNSRPAGTLIADPAQLKRRQAAAETAAAPRAANGRSAE